jgi:hypothetical protein
MVEKVGKLGSGGHSEGSADTNEAAKAAKTTGKTYGPLSSHLLLVFTVTGEEWH